MRSTLLALSLTASLTSLPGALLADTEQKVETLLEALSLEALFGVINRDSIAEADIVAQDFLGAVPGSGWQAQVSAIYDPALTWPKLVEAFAGGLSEAELDANIAFFSSPLGVKAVAAELRAREAFLDETVKDGAEEAGRILRQDDHPDLYKAEGIIEAYDLVEANVAGGLNWLNAFYTGFAEGEGFPSAMGEQEILSLIWSQEPTVREGSTDWLYGYLLLAYADLSEDEMKRYIAFAKTPEAQALNRVIFDGFGKVYEHTSFQLGLAIARQVGSQDI